MLPFADSIRYIRIKNAGAAHARNTGMKAARGKYISFLDSDDLYYDYKLELQVDFIEKYPENRVVCTDFSGMLKDGRIDTYHLRNYHDVWRKKNLDYLDIFEKKGQFRHKSFSEPIDFYTGDIFKHVIIEPIIPSNTLLFKREILEVVGFQDESIRSGQDYEFVVRICKYFNMAFLNFPTYKIRHHSDQLSKSAFMQHKSLLLKEIDNISLVGSVFERYAYSDQAFYLENKEMVVKRLSELYFRTALLWLEYGDSEKAKYWKEKSLYFNAQISLKKQIISYFILFNCPFFIGSRILRLKRHINR
jgi:glycosyltransferase involved in cell wall biosynthesis